MFFLSRYGIIYCVIVHSETSHFSPHHNLSKHIFTTIISNTVIQLVKKERISKRRDGSGRVKNRGRLKSGLKSHASFSSATRHQPPSLTLLSGDRFSPSSSLHSNQIPLRYKICLLAIKKGNQKSKTNRLLVKGTSGPLLSPLV